MTKTFTGTSIADCMAQAIEAGCGKWIYPVYRKISGQASLTLTNPEQV